MSKTETKSSSEPAIEPENIGPGIYHGMSDRMYRAIPAANQSTLKDMLSETPAHTRYKDLFGEETDSMRFGTAFHTLVIDPDSYPEQYVIWPGKTRAGKVWDAFEAQAVLDDKIVLRMVDDTALRLMVTSLREHPIAAKQFERGKERECVMVWYEGDILCKSKVDGFCNDDYPTLTDLKTAANISPESIERAVVNFGYDVQNAWYLRGARANEVKDPNFLFTFVETGGTTPHPRIVNAKDEPRHAVRVLELEPAAVNRGEMILKQALDLWRACATSKSWAAYPNRIERTKLPAWAKREVNQ